MTTLIEFAALGLGLGAVYVGLSTGLLLVYRATGIINFAQGAMAMWGAYVFAQLRQDGSLVLPIGTLYFPQPPGVAVSLLIGLVNAALLGVVAHYLVFRPVRRAPALAQVVVSIGLMVSLQALAVIRFGPNSITIAPFLPTGSIDVAGASVGLRELSMTGIMVILAALVWAYLRFTHSGRATRAASENERGAVLMGFSPDRLSLIALVLGALVSTVSVMMGGVLTGLAPANYTLMVVPALAVVLVARLDSIWLGVAGGLVLGIFQSELSLLSSRSWWPTWAQSGLDQVLPFLVVVVILFAFGKRLPARGSLQAVRLPDVRVPRLVPWKAGALLVAVVLCLVLFDQTYRFGLTTSLIMGMLALSYVIITGYLGQISLAQSAFAGAAGFTLSKLTTAWNVPFPLAILICSLVAAALGLLVALPAFRIRGVQLAIVTIAAALAIERFVFNNYSLTPASGNPVGQPTLFGLNFGVRQGRDLARLPFSLMVLAVLTIVVVAFVRMARGDTGRAFLAVRANERAAASAGIDVRRTKLIGFAMSAFVAGIAGCLIGYSQGQLSADSFSVLAGLTVLAVAYLGGITSFGGAIVAGLLGPLGLVYTALNQWFNLGNAYALITGIGLILTAILNPAGIAGEVGNQVVWVTRRFRRRGEPPSVAAVPVPTPVEMQKVTRGV